MPTSAGKSGRKRIDQVIGYANVSNLLDDEPSTFKHLPKLQIWFGTSHSMHNPFDSYQFVQKCMAAARLYRGPSVL
jgi:hypothetical protein